MIRPLRQADNAEIAQLIRSVLKEHGVDKPGTVYTDPTTDALYELFQTAGSAYFVATEADEIIGGCGIYPTAGLPEGCTELVKLYLHKNYRNKGIGKALMEKSIAQAKELGYHEVYLETLPELKNAIELYKKMGFVQIDQALGNSGHFACDLWMLMQF